MSRSTPILLAALALPAAIAIGMWPCLAHGGIIQWANQSGQSDWTSGASWVGGLPPAASDTAVFPDEAISQNPALAGSAPVLGVTFDTTSGAWNLTGAGTLTVGAGGIGFLNNSATARTSTISPAIVLGADQTWTVTRNTSQNMTATFSGLVSGTGRTLTVELDTVSGNPTPLLNLNNAANSFSGDLVVRALGSVGRITAANYGVQSTVSGSAVTPFGTGTLAIERGAVRIAPASSSVDASITQSIAFGKIGHAEVQLAKNSNASRSLVWTAPTLTRVNHGGLFVFWQTGTLGAAGANPRFLISGQGTTAMMAPYIVTSLSSGNRYPTFAQYDATNGLAVASLVTATVNAGILDSSLLANNGSEILDVGTAATLDADLDLRALRVANVNLSRTGAFDEIILRSGGLIITGQNNVTVSPDLVFGTAGSPVEAVIWAMAGQTYTATSRTLLSGNITATDLTKLGVLVKHNDAGTGPSMLDLAGTNNNISGTIRVVEGGLRISHAGAVAGHNVIHLNPFADVFFDVDETIAGLSGGGTGTSLNVGNNTTRMVTLAVPDATTRTSAISIRDRSAASAQLLGLTKSGLGTQILTGSSTYTGATTITAGVLQVDGALGATNVSVQGGTLAGRGTIGGSVTVHGGGTLAPGSSAGTLTLGGSLSLADLAGLVFELVSPWEYGFTGGPNPNDYVVVGGDLVLDGVLKVVGAPPAGTYTLFKYEGTLTDNTVNLSSLPAGSSLSVNDLIRTVDLYYVPEPATLALMGAGGLALLIRRRR